MTSVVVQIICSTLMILWYLVDIRAELQEINKHLRENARKDS